MGAGLAKGGPQKISPMRKKMIFSKGFLQMIKNRHRNRLNHSSDTIHNPIKGERS